MENRPRTYPPLPVGCPMTEKAYIQATKCPCPGGLKLLQPYHDESHLHTGVGHYTIDLAESNANEDYACAFTIKDNDHAFEKAGYDNGSIGSLVVAPCSKLKKDGKYVNETYAELCKNADYATYIPKEEASFCKQLGRQKEYVVLYNGEETICSVPLKSVPKGNIVYENSDFGTCP